MKIKEKEREKEKKKVNGVFILGSGFIARLSSALMKKKAALFFECVPLIRE